LERENLILRHWAGVLPANRYLLGRGPTGCDTTKPLIADDNDPEIQLVTDDTSPRDRSWPPASAVPSARDPYFQEQSDDVGSMNPSQTARASTTQQTMIPNSPIAPTAAPVFEKQGFESSPYPDTRKFKPHPLYDQRPLFDDYPSHVSDFEPVPALAAERLLVKRESVYAPPAAMPSLLSQRTDIASHDYYSTQSRPPYSRPADPYPSQSINGGHAEMNGSSATIGTNYYPAHLVSWPDPYAPSSAPQSLNRRQPPSTLTPVNAPVGQTPGSVSSASPSSQPTSASGSVPDQRLSTIAADPMYAPRRSVTYANGFPTSSGTPTSTYMQPSMQAQSAMYTHHTDGAQQSQQQQLHLHQQQQQQRQRQYHDGTVNSDSFRQ
jgi:hypothetical protein